MSAPAVVEAVPLVSTLEVAINAEHQAAQAAAESAVAHALRAGELLMQAKAQFPHGEFGAWLRTSFPFSDRTARGYMRLAGLDTEKRQRVANMSLRRALADIAEPKTSNDPALKLVASNGNARPQVPDDGDPVPEHHVRDAGVQVQVLACLHDAWDEATQATRLTFSPSFTVQASS